MASVQLPAPQLTGNVLFYDKPEPLNLERHRKLGLKQLPKPFAFARNGSAVPLAVTEFNLAAVCFPIIFAGDQRTPLAVMGLDGQTNMFIAEDGGVEAGIYLPAYIRRYPFVVANDEGAGRFVVCIDTGSPLLSDQPDLPLFDDKGELTAYAQNSIKFCEDYENERRRTEGFVKLLTDLDLFEKKEASFTPNKPDGTPGEPQRLAEYIGVSEAKLNDLPADKLLELRDNGALAQIYAHLFSLVNWDRLIGLTLARQIQAQQTAANG